MRLIGRSASTPRNSRRTEFVLNRPTSNGRSPLPWWYTSVGYSGPSHWQGRYAVSNVPSGVSTTTSHRPAVLGAPTVLTGGVVSAVTSTSGGASTARAKNVASPRSSALSRIVTTSMSSCRFVMAGSAVSIVAAPGLAFGRTGTPDGAITPWFVPVRAVPESDGVRPASPRSRRPGSRWRGPRRRVRRPQSRSRAAL